MPQQKRQRKGNERSMRERERERQRDRQTDRQTETERNRETQRQRESVLLDANTSHGTPHVLFRKSWRSKDGRKSQMHFYQEEGSRC